MHFFRKQGLICPAKLQYLNQRQPGCWMSLVKAMNVCDCWFAGPGGLIPDFLASRMEYVPLACAWKWR